MVIISILNFPPEQASKMYERFSESILFPEFISIRGPYVKAGDRGIQSITVYEFEEIRYVESREYIYRRISTYFDIPGLTYSADAWLDVDEASKFLS